MSPKLRTVHARPGGYRIQHWMRLSIARNACEASIELTTLIVISVLGPGTDIVAKLGPRTRVKAWRHEDNLIGDEASNQSR